MLIKHKSPLPPRNLALVTSGESLIVFSGVSLPVFPSRTNFKLHNISVTPKMVRKVVMDLDLSKASGSDCIPVVVLRKCEPEFSYILVS